MKKAHLTLFSLLLTANIFGAENAGLSGIVITDDTVENNNFTYPKSIFTVYFPNDPAERAKVLAYVSYKKLGKHEAMIELSDSKSGKYLDKCTFDAVEVTKLPWTHTITCEWGGRQSDTGIAISVYDKFSGKQEKIGETYLPAKRN